MLFCRFWAQHFLQFIKDSEIIEKINHLPLKLTNSNEVPNSSHKVYTPPLFPHSFWSNWNRSSWIGLKQIQSGSTIFLAILYNFYEVRQIIFILKVLIYYKENVCDYKLLFWKNDWGERQELPTNVFQILLLILAFLILYSTFFLPALILYVFIKDYARYKFHTWF